jgi:hypothetical protein
MRIKSGKATPAVESPDRRWTALAHGWRSDQQVQADPREEFEQPQGASTMATANTTNNPIVEDEVPEEPIPAMQLLLDNPFLLLFIGIAMPTVLYIVWGVMEIVGIPIAK